MGSTPSTAARLLPRLVVEYRGTRNAQVPISADDLDMSTGWRCIPVPPSEDPGWAISDTRHDYKTTWRRFRIEWGTS
jgi:hypothetical protein